MKTIPIIIYLIFIQCFTLFSQNDSVQYTKGFKFNEGFYLSFEDFKNNKPSIPSSKLVTRQISSGEDHTNVFFVGKTLSYYDSKGKETKIRSKKTWGYCHKNKVYYQKRGKFSPLYNIGSIIFFSEDIGHISYNTYEPGLPKTDFDGLGPNRTFLIDFNTGIRYESTIDNFLQLISVDKELYDEFIALKDQNEMRYKFFAYMNKFNERNPIYIKINKD